jgi:ComF family protein
MFQSLIHLFFPRYCNVCQDVLLKTENQICSSCIHDLPFTHLLEQKSPKLLLKFYGTLDLEFAYSIFNFHKEGTMQKLIHQLKYKNNQEIGTVFGNYYSKLIKESNLEFDFIVPVPLHPKKLKERGYNQLTTFGIALSKQLKKPFVDDLLIRNLYNETQTKKNRTQRLESLEKEKIFSIINSEKYQNKHLLLIDDVTTTGSTIIQCGKELKTINNLKLSIITICMAE